MAAARRVSWERDGGADEGLGCGGWMDRFVYPNIDGWTMDGCGFPGHGWSDVRHVINPRHK